MLLDVRGERFICTGKVFDTETSKSFRYVEKDTGQHGGDVWLDVSGWRGNRDRICWRLGVGTVVVCHVLRLEDIFCVLVRVPTAQI